MDSLQGTADPIILLSGLNTTPTVWDGVLRSLPSEFNGRAPEMPKLDDVDAIARALLEEMPPYFHLCGYSFGGYVALALLALCPERIRSLLLLSSTPESDTDQQKQLRLSLIGKLHAGEHDAIIADQARWMLHPKSAGRPEISQVWFSEARRYGSASLIAHLKACISRPNRLDLLRETRVPVAIVTGAGDQLFPVVKQQKLADAVGARLFRTVSDAAHGLPFEQPAEVADIIADWTRRACRHGECLKGLVGAPGLEPGTR